jgi:hypothetical protein
VLNCVAGHVDLLVADVRCSCSKVKVDKIAGVGWAFALISESRAMALVSPPDEHGRLAEYSAEVKGRTHIDRGISQSDTCPSPVITLEAAAMANDNYLHMTRQYTVPMSLRSGNRSRRYKMLSNMIVRSLSIYYQV